MDQEFTLIMVALFGGGGLGAIVKAFFDRKGSKETLETDTDYKNLSLQISTYQKQVEQLSRQELQCIERVTKLENRVDNLRESFDDEEQQHKVEIEAHRHLKHKAINLLTSHEVLLSLVKNSLTVCSCDAIPVEHTLFFHRDEIKMMVNDWSPKAQTIIEESDALIQKFMEERRARENYN